jgi:group I intron endonuclease
MQRRYYSVNCHDKDSDKLITFFQEKRLNPVLIYDNVHLEETRNKILKDTKGLTGIYLILNKITLDYYVGSASTGKLYTRFSNHLIHKTGSKIVKLAVIKYGLFNFSFIILELFPDVITKINNKDLLNLEDFYLKSLLPNYNILAEAGNSFGYKHTEITRIKMKAQYSQERRDQIRQLNFNKALSEETKERLRESALKRKKVIYSDKALLNMKKKSKPIIAFNLDGTVYGKYDSITEGAKSLQCSIKTISRILKTEKKILKKQ